MGQAILVRETMHPMYSSSTLGKRVSSVIPHAQAPVTLQLLKPEKSLVGQASCVALLETAIASIETALPAADFFAC